MLVQRILPAATRASIAALAISSAALMAAPSDAEWLKYPAPSIPRTSNGKPNLSAPAQKPQTGSLIFGEPGGLTPADTRLMSPLRRGEIQPWADALYRQRQARFGVDNPALRCFPTIGPGISSWLYRVLQTPTVTAFLPEAYPLPHGVPPGAH
jgi:hypothetical protein